jgi:Xaa-Pro aminopeptidase
LRKDLDSILAEKGADAMFLYSGSFKAVDMYYLTGFLAPDPFVFLKRVDDEPILVINSMEYSRAQKQSRVKDVRSYNDYNMFEIMKSAPDPKLGFSKFIATIAEKELGKASRIYIPPDFPAIYAEALRRAGLTVVPLFDVIEKARETKEPEEIDDIKAVQSIVEDATAEVIELVANADVDPQKTLVVREDGMKRPLTVHKIKSFLGHKFLDHNCVIEEEIIVACGPKGADPHYFGNPEDVIKANQPLILDIYPRNLHRRYCTDMTRTVVKGKASKDVKRMFEAVLEAKNTSIDSIRAGATGSEVNDLCCDILEKAGYPTTRRGKKVTKGFTHSLGHGVGLQVHEGPRLSEFYPFPLEPHNVVTVEPGLYDPEIGGVRLEDLVEVTKTGCINLTRMTIELEL